MEAIFHGECTCCSSPERITLEIETDYSEIKLKVKICGHNNTEEILINKNEIKNIRGVLKTIY